MALLEACLAAEEGVAGRHADNIAPSLLGGIVLIRSLRAARPRPAPGARRAVRRAGPPRPATCGRRRRAPSCPRDVPRAVALHQAAQVAAMVAALAIGGLRAAGPRHRRPHRRAGARGAPAGLPRGESRRRSRRARWAARSPAAARRRSRSRAGRESAERSARRWRAAYGARRPSERGPGRAEWTARGRGWSRIRRRRTMRFETERPASWQVCLACGNEVPETDPQPRCRQCGGLLEIRHRPPTFTARGAAPAVHRAARQAVRARRPRASGGSARSCSRPPTRSSRTPRATRRCCTASALDRWTGRRRICCSSTRATTRPARSRTAG